MTSRRTQRSRRMKYRSQLRTWRKPTTGLRKPNLNEKDFRWLNIQKKAEILGGKKEREKWKCWKWKTLRINEKPSKNHHQQSRPSRRKCISNEEQGGRDTALNSKSTKIKDDHNVQVSSRADESLIKKKSGLDKFAGEFYKEFIKE